MSNNIRENIEAKLTDEERFAMRAKMFLDWTEELGDSGLKADNSHVIAFGSKDLYEGKTPLVVNIHIKYLRDMLLALQRNGNNVVEIAFEKEGPIRLRGPFEKLYIYIAPRVEEEDDFNEN